MANLCGLQAFERSDKEDRFPLPFQDEILNEVAGYERYTVCDGYSGYFQISIAAERSEEDHLHYHHGDVLLTG